MSKDGRIAQFKALLQEIGVNPFGTWESQSSRFASDRRFALVTADAERQDLFDAACKEVAAARSKRSLATDRHSSTLEAPPSALHPFDQLLREHVTKKTSFARFCQKHLKDPRFTSLKTSREREKMFQRHMETIA
ncbi:hypothetical protein GGI04_002097 [Coemansia thaxteri]|nr:hypothetical protein GGI04_002097 [Coemansia thaxteri]